MTVSDGGPRASSHSRPPSEPTVPSGHQDTWDDDDWYEWNRYLDEQDEIVLNHMTEEWELA